MTKKFSVGGMSCSACSSGIERNISRLDGVINVMVSLLAKEMTVEFDENKISVEKIIAVVKKLGYTAEEYGAKSDKKLSDTERMKRRFILSLIILLPLLYLCLGSMLNLPTPIKTVSFPVQGVLALIVLIINKKFFISGVRALKNRAPNMDTLVSLGAASSFIYSLVVTLLLLLGKANPAHTFFDSSAMVVTLVTLGKWLEEISKKKTGDAVYKLGNLIPKTVTVIRDGKDQEILTTELEVGDVVVLKAGEYVAVDGEVIEGRASVDKSAITGESMPEEVTVNSEVSSGSILRDGYLLLKAKRVGDKTLFSKILETVKVAGASKAPIQKFADKVSGVFVPIVSAIALVTFIVWIIISKDLYQSFNFGISVLVISCPCALGLATPVAVMAATGRAASEGVLFKNAEVLQHACKIDVVLLDKTATITVGKPKVTDYINYTDESNDTLFPIISALESKSSHPLAECVIEYCGQSDKTVDGYEYVTGKGIIGNVDGVKYYLGNRELISGIDVPELPKEFSGKTVLYFADEIQLVSVFALSDYLKDDSKAAIAELNAKGIKTVMITGDNKSVAERIAKEVGITEYHAEVLPQDKYTIVEEYKKKGNFVAMVGDGINDSPALKSADVGVAMGTGTDIAIDSAEVVLVSGALSGLNAATSISEKSLKIIKENLFWAFFYNLLGIPIAAGALSFIGVVLTPAIASALMCCSSLFVVTNALRISGKKKQNKENTQFEKECEYTLSIDGMMCMHCVSKVETALKGVGGTADVKVNLDKKTATLSATKSVTAEDLVRAVEGQGFKVTEINKDVNTKN